MLSALWMCFVGASLCGAEAPPFAGPLRIEAENATDFQGTVDNNHEGFSGVGFVNTPNAVGRYIAWTVYLPEGVYYAHFRYGNGTTTNRAATLRQNGVRIERNLAFPSTGTWPNWAISEVVEIVSDADTTHTLRLEANTSGGLANMDYLEISSQPEVLYHLTVINGAGSGVYPAHATVPIAADPALPFVKWTGQVGNVLDVNASSTVVVMSPLHGNITVIATDEENLPDSYGEWMARSIMDRYPGFFNDGGDAWDYQKGTVLRGFEELWEVTGKEDYYNYIKASIDRAVGSTGTISGYNSTIYSLDEIKQTDLALFLYRQTGQERYRLAADRVRTQLDTQPRTQSGGFWHRQNYPNQMWLDGLYMAQPFYCEYGELFDQPENFADVAHQFREMYDRTLDPVSGLLYHGWDESKVAAWADPETGCSPIFWSRSMGWYLMALVDVLDHFPTDHPDRGDLIRMLQDLSAALAAVRDPDTGVWWQVPNYANDIGNYMESSSGLMFTYAFSKGARLGYLDASYRGIAEQSFRDHIAVFTYESTNGRLNLTQTCQGTGVGGSLWFYYNRLYYTNDTKGIGPLMMAATEIEFRQMQPLYSLTVAGGRGGGQYREGHPVRISAGPPPRGSVFLHWDGDVQELTNPLSPTTTLVMPGGDLNLHAVFSEPAAVPPAIWTMYDRP